jgi:hypothetical protein
VTFSRDMRRSEWSRVGPCASLNTAALSIRYPVPGLAALGVRTTWHFALRRRLTKNGELHLPRMRERMPQ